MDVIFLVLIDIKLWKIALVINIRIAIVINDYLP